MLSRDVQARAPQGGQGRLVYAASRLQEAGSGARTGVQGAGGGGSAGRQLRAAHGRRRQLLLVPRLVLPQRPPHHEAAASTANLAPSFDSTSTKIEVSSACKAAIRRQPVDAQLQQQVVQSTTLIQRRTGGVMCSSRKDSKQGDAGDAADHDAGDLAAR
jgi:hypothetical protein